MSVGTLSADQARYVNLVSTATRLDPKVVTAWVGSESGWGVYSPTHNYLNVGPSETYQSVDAAAARAAALINESPAYAGIRAAIPAGPVTQVDAIGASPWGTSAGTLGDVFHELTGVPAGPSAAAATAQPVGILGDIWGLVGGNSVVTQAGEIALSIVFVAGAMGLIGVGLAKLTARPAREVVESVNGTFGNAQTAAKLAALA